MMGDDGDHQAASNDEDMETLTLNDEIDGSGDRRRFSAVPAALNGGDPLLNPPSPSSSSPPTSPHLLDPPSYAEAVFTPFDPLSNSAGDDVSAGDIASPSDRLRGDRIFRSRRTAGAVYSISVADPQKELEPNSSASLVGGGTFVSYLIVTRVVGVAGDVGTSGKRDFRVRRRFRDVVALADRLGERYKGFFVPPRPDKSVVEGQLMYKYEFVEQRRLAIEKYLQRLVVHPVIGLSDEVKAFLQEPGKLPFSGSPKVGSRGVDESGRMQSEFDGQSVINTAQTPKGGRGFFSIIRDLKQSVTTEWAGTKPAIVEEDKEFLERKKKLQDLEQQLTTASQQAESLVKAQQDISEVMGELGLTFIRLSKYETEQANHQSQRIRAADIKSFATAAVKVSRLYRELNAHSVKNLDTLHEYLGLMLAVHTAFSDRSNALSTVQNIMSDLSSLYAKEERYEQTRILKEELKETIRKKEDAKKTATGEYERIKENNKYELDRLDMERHEDFVAMLKGFVVSQVGYAEKIASVWANVAEETNVKREQLY